MRHAMDTVYVLLEKHLDNGFVTVENAYLDFDQASARMEELMIVNEEKIAYKIVTRVVMEKPKKVKVDPLAGVNKFHPESPAHLVLLLKHHVVRLSTARTIAAGWGYNFRGHVANSRERFPVLLEEAMTAKGLSMHAEWVMC